GEQACAAIESWAPDLARELTGLAKGADVEAWQLGMLNARTEILATVGPLGEGECSTAVRLVPGAAPRTIQTWDWHDELDSAKTLVETPGPDGRTVKYFTEAGLLGKIGVSDAGVGVQRRVQVPADVRLVRGAEDRVQPHVAQLGLLRRRVRQAPDVGTAALHHVLRLRHEQQLAVPQPG
ncbi:MAG: hypothetical protein J0I87_03820, partial [Cellulomonas sp.]|nr:hypothetical protein [Cellulomonas sp.]